MSLTMKRGRDCVKFEVVDGEVESVVTLLPEDDEETLLRKMKRVIGLVEGPAVRAGDVIVSPGGDVSWPKPPWGDVSVQDVPGRARRAPAGPPEIPDRLKGEVEMETVSETVVTGNGWASLGDGEGLPSA